MISVNQAKEIIFKSARRFGKESIPLSKGYGRVLVENWFADRALPPYDRVTMDGIVINYDEANLDQLLRIDGIVGAGDPQASLSDGTTCMEIMTGAVLPLNSDTVIRYEDLEINNGLVRVLKEVKKGQNVHRKGEDRSRGDLLVQEYTKLGPAEIGLGASIGKAEITVANLPRCLVVSTGNELVDIHEEPLPHQIRRGNVFRLSSTLQQLGIEVKTDHLVDDKDLIKKKVKEYLREYDLLIFSGGVSKGKFDYLPEVFEELGIQKLLHRVAQRPGKPLWFGVHSSGVVVFGLPGNPISSYMCTLIYVQDWIRLCQGLSPKERPHAILTKEVSFKPELTYFLEVKLDFGNDGKIMATPMRGHGSGDLANLTNADAFIQLPSSKEIFTQGTSYPVYSFGLL